MLHLHSQIDEAACFIRDRWPQQPRVGIILGTGLGALADKIVDASVVDYASIPHFPTSTAIGHAGQLVCGELPGASVVAMQGRFHAYEGYSAAQISFPVRVMKALGVALLIVTNASGGLNPNFRCGDVMIVEDHINLMPVNPLIGLNDEQLGPRFPVMSRTYDRTLIRHALEISRRENFAAYRGVYAAVCGPNYETRAEYRFLRRIGADAVGMSTVPEVIAAAHAGLQIVAFSTITNICRPDALGITQGDEVLQTAATATAKIEALVLGLLKK